MTDCNLSSIMIPVPIQVKCIAGHKADERPASFICESAYIIVEKVLERWRQSGKSAKAPRADYFKVEGVDGHQYLMKHDLKADHWFLENRW